MVSIESFWENAELQISTRSTGIDFFFKNLNMVN